jgi:hypothetical protein
VPPALLLPLLLLLFEGGQGPLANGLKADVIITMSLVIL